MKKTAPFGSWASLVTSEMVTKDMIRLNYVRCDGKKIFWEEGRYEEKGRVQIVENVDGKQKELLTKEYNARSKVHEYGGCSFAVKNNLLFFVNFKDQRIYQLKDEKITPITPKSSNSRYVDIEIDEKRNVLFCVKEEHLSKEVVNKIVRIDIDTGKEHTIVEGCDFYSSIKLNPKEDKICFLRWNHPFLPWDQTELSICLIDEKGDVIEEEIVFGSPNESICQPKWGEDNTLYFVSDKTSFWNLYQYKDEKISSIYPCEFEFGYPNWLFGFSTYVVIGDKIACSYIDRAISYFAIIDLKSKSFEKISSSFTSFTSLQVYDDNKVAMIAASPTKEASVVVFDIDRREFKTIKESRKTSLSEEDISKAKLISFPGWEENKTYAFFYPPKNKDFIGEENTLPPLIVKSHGGPSAFSTNTLSLEIQFWTSRGFAFVDVNYGGSTGFGRKYRERLNNRWGIVDVEDCAKAVEYLEKNNKVDKDKVAIRGGSAGGYTTLAALVFTKNIFKAGASYYGVSDLVKLAQDTHKFESRYLDNLIGKYPEEREIYEKRSPVNHIDNFNCPVIFFQGGEDKVVLPNQSEKIFNALKKKKIPTAYVLFKDEGHGFRQKENVKNCLEMELYFYSKIFHFPLKEKIVSVNIENL